GTGELCVPGGGAVSAKPRQARLLVRPDWVAADGPVRGRVSAVGVRGTHTDYHLDSPARPGAVRAPRPPRRPPPGRRGRGEPPRRLGARPGGSLSRGRRLRRPCPAGC